MEALQFKNAKKIHTVFFIAFTILLLSGIVVIKQLYERSYTNQWVTHTYQVINIIDSVLLNIAEAEKQLELYTDEYNNKYLKLYNEALQRAQNELLQVRQFTIDNIAQQSRINRINKSLYNLNGLNGTKLKNAKKQTSLLKQHEKNIAQIKTLFHEMTAEELSLLKERIQISEHKKYVNNTLIIVFINLGCIFLLFSFLAIINLSKKNDQFYRQKEKLEQEKLLNQETQRLQLEFSLNAAKQGFWNLNLATHKIERSLLHDQIFGYSSFLPEWTIPRFLEHVHPDDHQLVVQAFKESQEHNVPLELECRIYRVDDQSLHWLSVTGKTFQLGWSKHMLGLVQDITERKHMEQLLADSEERWKFALENAHHGVWDWYVPEKIIYFSHYWKQMLGYQDDEIKNELSEFVGLMHPDDAEKVWKSINDHFEQRSGEYVCEVRFRCKDGSYKWVLERGKVISRASDGSVLRAIGTHTDINDFKENESNLKHLAEHDPLTGLINRSIFEDRLEQAILLAKRQENNLAVFFIDIDGFKQINDIYGHSIGDLILRATANRLLTCIRDMDSCARYGGDEFILLLQDIKGVESVINIAKDILHHYSKSFLIERHEFRMTLSIGISLFPKDGDDNLIGKADSAMYFVKNHGKNNYKLYEEQLSHTKRKN